MEQNKIANMIDTSLLRFKIGELSKMTGVSTRQLRYWEKKEFISAMDRVDDHDARVFGFKSYIKVALIKRLLDEGYTLTAANEKSKSLIKDSKWFHEFVRKSFCGVEKINGERAVNMGYFDDDHTKVLYGFNDESGVHYEVRDAKSEMEDSKPTKW
ncbi:MerR family transcriptional regulator [Paucilactobacillus suebicus]|uniref:MerR family transcriptional regulator n=1 Tax=Paucilactobacillus suebicus DSM 5007 = KCTC 3549 TaxID=1423807 RepID=A0A0R1WG93_9LACO|nr:MerR family transcriptional regulator [Paucilactobacillus suebicus]KRM12988.1 MerR family transcriptional regulator [Paucilactobacillus suebicus DSM 5007 = KCTC 3549]